MRMKVGYAKLGRSMPLTLDKCGTLGGDVEMAAVVKQLALRNPDKDFYLIGRNSGEDPVTVGMPPNVFNPWIEWAPTIRRALNYHKLNYANLTIEDHSKTLSVIRGVTGDLIKSMDHIVMWVGQHGTSNSPLPSIKDRSIFTKPYDWATLYGGYLLHGITAWRDEDPIKREEILLNADPRNTVKYRDAAWPWRHPVLAQFNYHSGKVKHERFGRGRRAFEYFASPAINPDGWEDIGYEHDGEVWSSRSRSVYSRLEINGLMPGTPFGDLISTNLEHAGRARFGLFINEARRAVGMPVSRLRAMEQWVIPLRPDFIHGTWSKDSQKTLGLTIEPAPWSDYFTKLHSVHSTFTTPSSGSGWATTKPWEAFAAGTVCFFHPQYDTQHHILNGASRELRDFLRVDMPKTLARRVDMVHKDAEIWRWVVDLQNQHYRNAIDEAAFLRRIEERLAK